jgi:pyridoxamine 5'-phosphate oxidase
MSASNPIAEFQKAVARAQRHGVDTTPASLATADADARPSVRIILLRGVDERGFVFYTNYNSRKAREMASNPRVALMFFWAAPERQVRIEGTAAQVAAAESDAYFASRPLESRLSVYASRQSEIVESRQALDARLEAVARRFPHGQVPRPEWWGGYRVTPHEMEFWQGRVGRMHDRLRYTRQADSSWRRDRLAP